MKLIIRFLTITLILFVYVVGCSKETTVEQLMEKAITLVNNGQTDEAREILEKAIKKAEKEEGSDAPAILNPLSVLALISQNQQNYSEAESLYRRAITIASKNFGPDSVQVAKIMNNLSALLYSQNQFEQALSLYEQSLAIAQNHFPENDPRLNTLKKNIAAIKSLISDETQSASVASNRTGNAGHEILDLASEEIKKAALDRLSSMNILLFNLHPMKPVRIFGKGVVLPYSCIKKENEEDQNGVKMILLFAAIENPDKKGSFIFKNSRLVSYESYMGLLEKGGVQSIEKSLIEAFPDLYSFFGDQNNSNLRKNV